MSQEKTMNVNRAAYMTGKSLPLEVRNAPYTSPAEDEIVVKNHAVAINPVDWIKQAMGSVMFSWIKYPFPLGSDVSGEVVEVGKGVTRFKIGDRVLGQAVGMDKRSNGAAEGAFQNYSILRTNLVSNIPDSLSYERACVVPLGLSTAACALFQQELLALRHPTSKTDRTIGETVLIWGGSSSVGSNAIQLAVASGYDVIATASPKNFEYVKGLGAIQVYDYKSKTIIQDLIAAFKNKKCAGAVAIGNDSLKPCVDVVAACKGKKFVAQATATLPDEMPSSIFDYVAFMLAFLWSSIGDVVKSKVKRVPIKFIFGSDLMVDEIGQMIYRDFLPTALENGEFVASPEPQVIGTGLERIQEALDIHRKGVSAKKVVVSL